MLSRPTDVWRADRAGVTYLQDIQKKSQLQRFKFAFRHTRRTIFQTPGIQYTSLREHREPNAAIVDHGKIFFPKSWRARKGNPEKYLIRKLFQNKYWSQESPTIPILFMADIQTEIAKPDLAFFKYERDAFIIQF